MPEDFMVYRKKQLRKVNSIRRAASQPADKSLPVLNESQVLFSAAAEAHGEPRSCYNCTFFNHDRSCKLLPKEIAIRKLKYPPEPTSDSKVIEYWPVCGYWVYGEPNYGPEVCLADIDPESAGLGWVNAPSVGLDYGGACCGGADGGDDCDYYISEDDDMHPEPTSSGFCRVLQKNVNAMDCCGAWTDDDWITWQQAQVLLKGK